jgi:PAS domain S-box-containing protein
MASELTIPESERPKLQSTFSLLDKTVLEMIMAHQPLSRVLESLCLTVEESFEDLLCSILLLDPDGVTLRHGAAPRLPRAYIEAIDGAKIGPRAGSCGTAAFLRQPVIVSDIATDPLWNSYRELALPHNLHACWSVPIFTPDGNILGTFACYYREIRTPESIHMLLMDRARDLAALAIAHCRTKIELHSVETRYRSLVERLPAITYIAEVGVNGRWLFVSPQIESMLGYKPEEFTQDAGMWMRSIHKDDREVALAAEKRVQETGEWYKAEYRMCARDGRILWFRDEGVILTELAAPVPVMQGVLYEITEYKRLEEQLRQAQKMEAVGQLAGGIAHDFNNLLMIIAAHNDRIRETLAPADPLCADAGEIQHAVTRAASLIQQLLTFSRRQRLQPTVLDVAAVLQDVTSMIRRLVVENIDLQVEVAPDLFHVKADRSQLEQALLNLAVNARDAMPDGGKLSIRVHNVHFPVTQTFGHGSLSPGDYVMAVVSDNGAGMSTEIQQRIFEPFFTTKGPGKGTGLGLSTVYGLIKQSKGAISVESEPNRGSTFKLFFPACRSQVTAEDEGNSNGGSVESGSETILLVEDQVAIREVASDYLQRLGYNVLTAPDGVAALEVVQSLRHPVDLLVTDVVMPNMGGAELGKRLSQLYPDIRILYMSGYPDVSVPGENNAAVVREFLPKPFALSTLAAKIRSILNGQSGPSLSRAAGRAK